MYNNLCGLEQSGSLLGSYPRGRKFKSCTHNCVHTLNNKKKGTEFVSVSFFI